MKAPVPKPEKVVTARNASIDDRATRWLAVEAAQRALNEAVREVVPLESEAFDRAYTAYRQANAASGSDGAPWDYREVVALWRKVVVAQQHLNAAVEVLEPTTPEHCQALGLSGALFEALEEYRRVATEAGLDRQPGTRAPS